MAFVTPPHSVVQRVAEAAANVLGITADVVHELLEVSADALRFAPIVGLEEAARTLLNIWDALQLVDVRVLYVISAASPDTASVDQPASLSAPHRAVRHHSHVRPRGDRRRGRRGRRGAPGARRPIGRVRTCC